MEVFRIATAQYATDLVSSGASNRWNKKGEFVIYAGSSRSLSTLELIVYRNFIKPEISYKVMVVSVAGDEQNIKTIKAEDLPDNWRKFEAYPKLQQMGSYWYNSKETLILKVPSAVIPYEFNYIINTEHIDFKSKVQLARTENYFWDGRLLI